MNDIFTLVLLNLEKVGIGIALFLGAYLANMGLGVWKNVKIEGYDFSWRLILQSVIKFIVLILSIGLLSIVVSTVPIYATYIGIEIEAETMSTIDSLVIISSFLYAAIKYIKDAIVKLSEIFNQ